MNWLNFIKQHVNKGLMLSIGISMINYVALLHSSLADGSLSDEELHQLVTTGSGIELILLVVVMAVLKLRK